VSRRRSVRPEVPGVRKIRVVCTDRGQHPQVTFGTVAVWRDDAGWRIRPNLVGGEYVDLSTTEPDYTGPQPDRLHKNYPLRCKRCGRDTPIRQDTLEKVCPRLAEADTLKFDISLMS